jgi:GDPmannose 4,6-dehydratase
MKALIFGVKGQDGTYLKKLLLLKQIEVIGVSRENDLIKGDIKDYPFVEGLIKYHQPDYVFHFAAVSSTSHLHLFENNDTIGTGTFNILEAVRIHCSSAKVFLSGSAMQFKNEGNPIDIDSAFDASSPYSISRIQSIYTGRYYKHHFGLHVYIGYFFNHDSPLRSENHVNQKIVRFIQRVPSILDEKLEIGNVKIRKEFGFAGDYVEAVWELINQDKIFEAIIGTGIVFSIEDWLTYCFGTINKNWKDYCITNNNYVTHYDVLISNPQIINNLGWYPSTTFYQLADLMLNNQL